MTEITIFTLDQNTVFTINAVKDDGTAYVEADINLVRLLMRGPRNDTTKYAAVTLAFVSGNTYTGTMTGTLPTEGYWEFQLEYTLSTNAKPVHSKIIRKYVGATIVPI